MNIEGFAKELNVRINCNFDSVIIVDSGGVKGTGKSVFSMSLAKALCKLINYSFSLDLIIFNPDEARIVELVKTLPDGAPIIIDEASKVFYKRDFQKDYQKNLIKFINVCRKFRKIIILNNPDFWDLDKDLRNLADFRAVIVKRGLVQIRGKSPNPDLKDKWLRDASIEKIEESTKGNITNLDGVCAALRRLPNHLYDITIPDMDKDEYSRYENLAKKEELKSFIEDKPTEYILLRIMAMTTTELAERISKLASLLPEDVLIKEGLENFRSMGLKSIATLINNIFYSTSWAKEQARPIVSFEYFRLWVQEAEGRLNYDFNLNNLIISRRLQLRKDKKTLKNESILQDLTPSMALPNSPGTLDSKEVV